MSEPGGPPAGATATLEALVDRLGLAAEQLRDGGLDPAAAAEVVEQCAQTAAQASAELERLARLAASDAGAARPGQDQLL